jgi:hypothetical protein
LVTRSFSTARLARLGRLDALERRRMNGYRSLADLEAALRRGDLVAFRQPRRRVVVELEGMPEEVLRPPAIDDQKHEIAVILFDSAGRRLDVECEIALPDEGKSDSPSWPPREGHISAGSASHPGGSWPVTRPPPCPRFLQLPQQFQLLAARSRLVT